METIEIVIPSHKRQNAIRTLNLLPKSIVCVPESQYKEYKKNYPNAKFDVHSDKLLGLSMKRNYIYQKYKNVVMIDDDLISVNRTYIKKENKNKRLTGEEFYWLIQDTYNIVKQTNAKVFGFPLESNPLYYSGNEPISLGKFIAGGFQGILWDKDLYYPDVEYMTGQDDFITLLTAYYQRYVYVDNRFTLNFYKTGTNKGGVQDYLTKQIKIDSIKYIRKCFGESVKVVKGKNGRYYDIKGNIKIW